MADPLDSEDSTIDNTIAEEYRRLNAVDESATQTGDEATPAAATATDTAPAPADTRARDASGKFTKTESAAPDASTPQTPIEGEQVAVDTPLVSTTGQPIDINRAPSSWKPAAKAAWGALPEDVRKEIYRREGDFLFGNKDLKETADFGRSIKSTLEPYRMLIEAEGGTPEKAIADTMRTAALFRVGTPQQKLDALKQIDAQFNCGLNQDFANAVNRKVAEITGQQPPAQTQTQEFRDPRVDQLLQRQEQEQNDRLQRMQRENNAAAGVFLNAKDAKGALLHPFVDNVMDDMILRSQNISRLNPAMSAKEVFEKAYDEACWNNSEVRDVLIGQRQAAAQQPVDNLRKLEDAKRASGVNLPRRGSLPAGEAVGTMGDTILNTYRTLTA